MPETGAEVEEKKRYLAIIQLKSDSDMPRIAKAVPAISGLLDSVSGGEREQAFRSNDGLLFGVFIKTAKPSAVIRSSFEKLHETINGDTFLLIETGEDFAGIGFSRAWTWLQHH